MSIFTRIFQRKAAPINEAEASNVRVADSVQVGEGLDKSEISVLNRIREMEKIFSDIDKGIDEITGTDYRIITMTDWLTAMRVADVPWNGKYQSSWVSLFDIFQNMVQDAHIDGAIDIIKEGLTSKDFYIANESGDRNDEATKIFQSAWFYAYLNMVVDTKLWGFGLIQIRNVDYSDFTLEVSEVNRKHVRPDLGGLVKATFDTNVWRSWDKKPYSDWTIFLFDNNLGKLNRSVRWWIYKTEVARFWAKYNQMYGVPPVIAKTAIKDVKRKDNAINMLKNFIKSRWMAIDTQDEIIPFDTKGSAAGQQFFENLIRLCDEQISKTLLGSTMVMDDGSSRAQSEVHEKNVDKTIKSYARKALFSVNSDLIPKLQKMGFPLPKGARFIWDNSEKMSMKDRADIVTTLNSTYKVAEDVAGEFVGIELEEREEKPFDPKFSIPGKDEKK